MIITKVIIIIKVNNCSIANVTVVGIFEKQNENLLKHIFHTYACCEHKVGKSTLTSVKCRQVGESRNNADVIPYIVERF